MPAPQVAEAVEPWHLDEAESVALAYHRAAGGDAWAALIAMARDALAEMEHADSIIRDRGRQVSHGYVRGRLDG